MKTTALIERGKDGTYGVYTPDINSVIIGEGNTVAEAKADFMNSVKEIKEAYHEHGDKLPDELNDIEFEFKYDVSALFNVYNWINATQFAKVAGINSSLMRQYKQGLSYISEAQTMKIERAFHRFGQELTAVKLL
ncbi:hypothetical protein FACS189467_8560 [Bacteroidia bacterium]|nr:hypothetical protein FACS189467_8560 [Bacteroidia bacterium]